MGKSWEKRSEWEERGTANGEMIRDFVTEEQFHAADKVKIGQVRSSF